ncbi:MAG TPA: DUF4476 domain-containing protein [Chitinophagales bacterium]|nr:DUF4476 domain-containing protein [Chitinophagales bacterium]
MPTRFTHLYLLIAAACNCLLLLPPLAAQTTSASSQGADLIIYTRQGQTKFTVGVNGILYAGNPVSGIRITQVPAPLCVVKIFIASPHLDTIVQNIYLKNTGNYYYNLDTLPTAKHLHLFYEAEDLLPRQLKGFISKTFLPLALKHVVIDTIAFYNIRGNAQLAEGSKMTQIRNIWLKQGNFCTKTPARNATTAAITGKITDRSFEADKLRIAKQQISAGCFSAAEITQLLTRFDFERVKLDLAKFAYHYLTDTENSLLLATAFEFDSSVKEWTDYVATMQNMINK